MIRAWRGQQVQVMHPNQMIEPDYAAQRREMVERQLRRRGIHDQGVLDAMLVIPRHEFVPEEFRGQAYEDKPISIGEGQTISQPFIVAAMIEAMELTGKEKVLEVGAGSGYAAAIISRLAAMVYTIESHPRLATAAHERLARLGFMNVAVHTGDGSAGLPEAAPFDAILVAAAAPIVPQPLVSQLANRGRMAIPIGDEGAQELVVMKKLNGEIHSRTLHHCSFVPLVGRYGFSR
ncbi:MAG TPA: protein-L-isoaspartate(D-aspartate) O-methyltransferase [Candidatus Acidoferrales bacterium]|nr:protein-L-isoaspartate(D-aspartate) O-methyltransferase [Candidatus Acidoferrales bacterium]